MFVSWFSTLWFLFEGDDFLKLNSSHGILIGVSACVVGSGFAVKSLWLISQGYSTTLTWVQGIELPYGVPIQFGLAIFVIVMGLKLIHDSDKSRRETKEADR